MRDILLNMYMRNLLVAVNMQHSYSAASKRPESRNYDLIRFYVQYAFLLGSKLGVSQLQTA